MASSPPPPFSASLPNPKKRPSMSSQASFQGASKKPRLHPLRNSSLPVTTDTNAISSAHSETGSMANSRVSGTSHKLPGRRGRPKKSTQLNDDDLLGATGLNADSNSQPGRASKSVISTKSGAAAADDDEEEDDGVDHDMGDDEKRRIAEDKVLEKARMYRLAGTLDEDAHSRFNSWHSTKLDQNPLRRMANATVSQSLGKAPLQAISFYTKHFVGEILERAREVQLEFAASYDKARDDEMKRRARELEAYDRKYEMGDLSELEGRPIELIAARDLGKKLKKEVNEYIPNPHKGGLLPDHLREAVRRYRADGEGAGVGYQGLSHPLLGLPGAATGRVGDGATPRRLFR